MGLGVGEPQAATLAEGEEGDTGMLAEHLALGREHEARLKGLRRYLLEIPAVAAGRDKANLLALGLVGNGEAKGTRQRAYFLLVNVGEREERAFQLVLLHGPQDVGLVLPMVTSAAQHVTPGPRVLLAADVVAGGNVIGAENGGAGEDRPELDVLVAAHAGVRGAARAGTRGRNRR